MIGRLCSISSKHKIFIFSDQPEDQEGLYFLENGAIGYANTYISSVLFNQALDVVLSGRVWIGHTLMNRLVRSLAGGKQSAEDPVVGWKDVVLTDRENEIAGLITQGHTNIDIAKILSISERTVKAHLSSIYKKTNTQGRLQLALMLHKLTP